jgi:CheY-like chemotaxis protein
MSARTRHEAARGLDRLSGWSFYSLVVSVAVVAIGLTILADFGDAVAVFLVGLLIVVLLRQRNDAPPARDGRRGRAGLAAKRSADPRDPRRRPDGRRHRGSSRRLLDAGAFDYLTKPVNVRRFLDVVDRCLGSREEAEA